MKETAAELVKASIVHTETLDTLEVLWNPARYRIHRRNRFHGSRVLGGEPSLQLTGGEARFETELFLDTTDQPPGPQRDARHIVEQLSGWMSSARGKTSPPRVVFVWGPFRFDGFIELLSEEWLHFDPDGTPVRAWVTLVLRR